MPFQTVKDPQTGQERQVYVAPRGTGNQQQQPAAKPQQQGGSNPLQTMAGLASDFLQFSPVFSPVTGLTDAARSLSTGVQEFQRTGDLGKAYSAAQQQYMQGLEGPGVFRGAKRVVNNAAVGLVQETNDAIQETFGGQATTSKNKNLPVAGLTLSRAKSSGPAEDLATGIVQAALAWIPASRAVGLAAKGLGMLPGAASVGNATGTALNALKATKAAQAAAKVPLVAPVGRALASNTLTKAAATGALVDYAALDQHEGRLYDLVDQVQRTVTGTPLEVPVLDYLKSDPNDVGATGRLKNVVEGALVGTGVKLALRAFRAARSGARVLNAPPEAKPQALEQLQKDTDSLNLELIRQASSVPDVGPPLSVVQPQVLPDLQPPSYSQVAEVSPQEIIAAPQVMQFKEAGRLTKTGASGSLAQSSEYNDVLAGVISVWRDVKGQLGKPGLVYVVNGHNRLRLAKLSGADKVLVRYLDAQTAEEARSLGALQNIAEGQGTPVDAAKFMRDTGKNADDMAAEGINLSGPVASQAVPLSRLPQNLFDRVATGKLELSKAVALGSEALDPQVINDVATEAVKRKWSAEKISQAMQEAKFAQTQTSGDDLLSLLGDEWASKTSNFNQLLDVRTEAFKSLREEMVALTSAAREGRRGILESAGNVIDVAGSQAARGQAAQAVEVFNRVTGYTGPVRDLLNEMADQVKGKRTAKAVVGENLDRLRQAIDDEINGPRLPMEQVPTAPVAEAAPIPATTRPTPLADALEANLKAMAQTDANVYRRIGQSIDTQRQGLQQLADPALPPAAPVAKADLPAAGPTTQEIQELDATLARSMANLSPEQRAAVRDQMLAKKYGAAPEVEPAAAQMMAEEPPAQAMDQAPGSGGEPPLPPAPPEPPVIVTSPVPPDDWGMTLARQIENNRQAIEDGDMTVDDLLQNNVLKVESPSGMTTYVPDAPPEMVEAYRAYGDLVSRVDATGIPVMSEERIAYDAAAWLEKSNYSSKAVLENLAKISGPLSNYQDNLVALRSAMLLADHNNYQAGIAANKWLNAAADESANMGQRAAELVSAAAAADRANRAVESVTRPLGQLMRSTQIQRPAPGSLPFDGAPVQARNIAEEMEEAFAKEIDVPVSETIGSKVSPELEQAIRTGDFSSPQVAEELDALALNVSQGAVTPGFSQGFWSNLNKSGAIGAKGLMLYRSSQLLSSGITFWGNVINSALRTVEMPLTQATGALMQGAPVRASRSLMIYGQLANNVLGSLRMGVESFKVGRGLFDLSHEQADFLDRLAAQDAQGQLLISPQKGEWDLNTMPWIGVQDKAMWAIAQKRIWQTLNLSTRLQVAADTAFKTLVGQSFEYVRNIQPGLDNAVRLGMDGNSKEAWDFARQYAQAAVDRSLRDVTINGKTILDGVMESPHAQTAMRWATFTDDIWAQMQPRTMTYGSKLAEAKGLKGAEADQFAKDYVANGSKLFGAIPGDDVPWFARTFSLMPRIWQMGLDSPMAPLFSLIQPFNRTPGDIVKSVARKTPLAPLVDTWWRDVFSEDALTRDRAWGDIGTGALAITAASLAMSHGRVEFTGGGPMEPQSRRKWMEQEGKQPYSFRIRMGEDENGNPVFSDWVSMRALDPFSSLFGGLADYQELANKVPSEARERLGGALVLDLVTAVASGQLQKSYYTGFSEFAQMLLGLGELDTAPNKRHPAARYVERLVASLQPFSSAMRAGRRIEDPIAREVPASNNPNIAMRLFEETFNEIRNQTPGWSESLPPRRNWITGDPITLSGVWGDQFLPPEAPWLSTVMQYSPLSPFQLKGEPGEMVLREMGQLTGRGAGFMGPRATDFTDGGKIKANRLDPFEFEQYVLAISRTPDQFGRTLLQALEEEIKSELYQENPQGTPSERVVSLRAAALNNVITQYMKLGREAFLDSPAGKRLRDNADWAEGANRDVQYRLKYGQEIDPKAFVEALN